MRTPTELELTFGERLAKARRIAGFTQAELAERLGIGRRSISRYEDGYHAPPNKAVYIAWSVVTNVPVEWLETGADMDAATARYLARMSHPTAHVMQLVLDIAS